MQVVFFLLSQKCIALQSDLQTNTKTRLYLVQNKARLELQAGTKILEMQTFCSFFFPGLLSEPTKFA